MANVSKVILGIAIAVVSIASPAFAAWYASPKRSVNFRSSQQTFQNKQPPKRRSMLCHSVPRSVDDPTLTGGGSIGYNENLRLNQW